MAMPWKETTMLDDRVMFISDYLTQDYTVADLCRIYQISRKTAYKFISRYDEFGPEGLHDLARAPRSHPNETTEQMQDLIVNLRTQHPTWGPRKLRAVLGRDWHDIGPPAASTIGAILLRNGLTTPARRRTNQRATPSLALSTPDAPNHVWCADFKGHFTLANGQRCYPFTLTDAYSRLLIRCQALAQPDTDSTKPLWVAAFREYGLPDVIRTDNGAPFATTGLGGLSLLSIWWIKLGIRPQRIKPGKPQQNGQHERMHRTLKAEATKPPQANLRSQQKVFDRFRHEYNNLRPHEALDQETPASVYVPSPRQYPLRLPEVQYPSGTLVRKVHHNGCLRRKGDEIFVSQTLAGEPVGLRQLDEHHWALYFGPLPLAILDAHHGTLVRSKAAADTLQQLLKEDQD
jgi:transposase InsO family protein